MEMDDKDAFDFWYDGHAGHLVFVAQKCEQLPLAIEWLGPDPVQDKFILQTRSHLYDITVGNC